MNYRSEGQQQREQLLTIVDGGTAQQLFSFLQGFHRRPFQNFADVMVYNGVIDDEIDFIDCTGTKYKVTPLIITAGKGSYEKTKILLVHGANPNKQCATGDTALNLAVHRQKYPIVDLLLQYHANPNVFNQAGKTALHRAVTSYTDENAKHIQPLLNAGADLNIEDHNQRIPLTEAVIANKPKIIDVLLSHDQTLIQHSYRAAIIASRLGHNQCLETLLNYGMDPNITDRTNTTPLHVAVRSLKLSTVRILVANGADPNLANNRGESAIDIAKYLQPDQQQNFINVLNHTPRLALSDFRSYKSGNAVSSVYPLLRSHPNWTLDSNEFRSQTAQDSSIENLLDASPSTFWSCPQSKNAWIIFDLKYQHNITGVRIIGCENQSTPKNGHFDVSNTLNGPWLKVKDFTCLLTQENKNDFFFPSLKTRFIRVYILDNYGGKDIRIREIAFFGVDMRLIHLLQEYGLENSLQTLLENGINDLETLNENQDEILNSSDKYLHVNDHFKFIRLTESLRSPRLTFLEWFHLPQTTVIAGDKFQTFSVAADEGVTDRVKLEEKLENSPQARTVLMRDLEPIQGRSLVDFPGYTITQPGRYQIRVVSYESPDIHTPWQEIVVGSTLPYAAKLDTLADEHLYLSSTIRLSNETASDKESTVLSQKNSTTTFTREDNRAFITNVYESENDDTEDDINLISLKSIEDSPYYFPLTKTSDTTETMFVNYQPKQPYEAEHYTQTKAVDYFDHSTNTDDDYEDSIRSHNPLNSKSQSEIHLTPSKYRSVSRTPLSNIFPHTNINNQKSSDEYETLGFGERIVIPTKYRLLQDRLNKLLKGENAIRPEQQSQFQQQQSQNQDESKQESSPRHRQSQYQRRQQSRKRTESKEEPLQQSHYQPREKSRQQNGSAREPSLEQEQSHYYELDTLQNRNESARESPARQQRHDQLQNQSVWIQNLPSTPPQQQQSQYHPRLQSRPRNGFEREASPQQQRPATYYEIGQSPTQNDSVPESPSRQQQSQYQKRQQSQKRTESDDEPLQQQQQQQPQYHQHDQLQNQNALVQNSSSTPPQQEQSQYHPRQQSRPRNGFEREASPQQQRPATYYEIGQSPKQNDSVPESPSRQQQSQYQQRQKSQKRTESDDEPLQQQQPQYHQHDQLQNQSVWIQNSSSTPPQQQQSQYQQRQQSGQRNGLERESSPERPRSQKNKGSTRESPSQQQQQQSRQRKDSESEILPPQAKQQQRSRKRNEAEQDSSDVPRHYDEIPRPHIESDEESQVQQQQHLVIIGNIDQDNLKPLYNRYQVISGDLELRESPSDLSLHPNESKPGQMQLVFKATLQGSKVQERAKNSMYQFSNDRSRTQSTSNINNPNNVNITTFPTSPQSSINADQRNKNTTNIVSNHEREDSPESIPNSRSNSISYIVRAPTALTKPDDDKRTTTEHFPSVQPSSRPDEPIRRRTSDNRSSGTESNRHSPLPNQPVPSNIKTHTENDSDLEDRHERNRFSPQNHASSKYEEHPLKQTDNSRHSPVQSSSKSLEQKPKYYFGEYVQNQSSSDEDSDEAECETFGHDSQPRPLANTYMKRNLDYPSITSPPFPIHTHHNSENLQFSQQSDVGTTTDTNLTQLQRRSPTAYQSRVGQTQNSPRNSPTFITKKQIPPHVDYEISDAYPVSSNGNDVNPKVSNSTSSTTGFQQHRTNSDDYEQNSGIHIKTVQSASQLNRNRHDEHQSEYEGDDPNQDEDNMNPYEDDDDQDIHDHQDDGTYMAGVNDDDNDSHHSSNTPQSGVNALVKENPVRDIPPSFQPIQYPSSVSTALPGPTRSMTTTTTSSKTPLEITVRTADHSHLYTSGIIPPKLPSTPTTDITDEITEREPINKRYNFRQSPDPYRRDSQDNNEEDAEDSDSMSEIRQHNRDRLAKNQAESKLRDYGTQSEERSTRSIGTMSEPVQTRNAGNEVQPQSSGTQTPRLLQQEQQDEIDLRQPHQDLRTNGYYPSQRSTSLDHRNKYISSSPRSPRQKDILDYDQHQVPHQSQYNDDPRDQYITTRNDYQRPTTHRPHSSSQTRQHIPSSTSPHRPPPPPAEYRSRVANDRYRTPSPSNHHRLTERQRSRSPSPSNQNQIRPSTDRYRTNSPPSQRRSRPPQRSPSPPTSRRHISSTANLPRTPSPPAAYRSRSPDDRHRSPTSPSKNYARKTIDRRQMASVETDTSLDGMQPKQHRSTQAELPLTRDYELTTNVEKKHPSQTSHSTDLNKRSSHSQYQTLNSSLPKRQEYISTSANENNYKSLRGDDEPPSTRKNYRIRPVQDDSYSNNYEEIPYKQNGSISPEYNRTSDRPKDYTTKTFNGDHDQQTRPTNEPISDEEEHQGTLNFTNGVPNEDYIKQLPSGGSISIPSPTVIQPYSLPRSYGRNISPTYPKHERLDNRRKIPKSPPLHYGHRQRVPSIKDVLYIGSQNIIQQSPNNEVAAEFKIRYIEDDEFTTDNNNIHSSTLKRDDLRSKNNRILLLPVLNSSRTYVFEKQSVPRHQMRQSRTNGNFYLATSPTLRSLDSSFQVDESEIDPLTQMIDSDQLTGHALRSQVA